jgi:glycerol uptake facilitator-like aquaporin
MFYCWSCDLAKELPQTSRGNVYIMIMIEHFSKWVKLVVLSNKSSDSTSQAFLQQVLGTFGLLLNALLIKDQNSKENFKTYLIMFSLTITKLQRIILKLMAL